uniref:Uncharacterized protein n=1 Tax=Leptobrachium leishanense TaxID=445787 RepID=A0A8C5QZH4_9ANUR
MDLYLIRWRKLPRTENRCCFQIRTCLAIVMASANLEEELVCSICLERFTDPVMLECGHNFCRVCISRALDAQEGPYSCPECRRVFQERPKLMRNLKLSNIVEHFSSATPGEAATGVSCTFCANVKVPAIKTCLLCEVSMCPRHLGTHSKSKEHVLTEPTSTPRDKKCSVHRKFLTHFCMEDYTCICESCSVSGKHKGHRVELLDEAMQKKQRQLGEALQTLTWGMEDIARSIEMLEKRKREVQEKTASVTKMFTDFTKDLRRQVDNLEKSGCREISSREEQVLLDICAKISELKTKQNKAHLKMVDVEKLRNISDPSVLLKTPFQAVESIGDDCHQNPQLALDEATLTEVLHDHCKSFTAAVSKLKSRLFPQKISPDMLLDVSTAGNSVTVSKDLKCITYSSNQMVRADNVQRFTACQALSVGNISKGQYYWEVETSGSGDWKIGVAYPSIERKGPKSFIGETEKSWCMARSAELFWTIHKSTKVIIQRGLDVCQYGIFLDYSAGQLSFYRLSEPIEHLYTFNATFTEPLHPAFYVGINAWVRILSCDDHCPTAFRHNNASQ